MHGAGLYDEVAQVPLILAAPGLPGGAVVSSQVSLVDLMPTLAELAGAPIDGLDGRSLLPLVDGSERRRPPALIVGTDDGAVSQLAVRHAAVEADPPARLGEEEAYRLDLDPRELREPARCARRAARVTARARARPPSRASG